MLGMPAHFQLLGISQNASAEDVEVIYMMEGIMRRDAMSQPILTKFSFLGKVFSYGRVCTPKSLFRLSLRAHHSLKRCVVCQML